MRNLATPPRRSGNYDVAPKNRAARRIKEAIRRSWPTVNITQKEDGTWSYRTTPIDGVIYLSSGFKTDFDAQMDADRRFHFKNLKFTWS